MNPKSQKAGLAFAAVAGVVVLALWALSLSDPATSSQFPSTSSQTSGSGNGLSWVPQQPPYVGSTNYTTTTWSCNYTGTNATTTQTNST